MKGKNSSGEDIEVSVTGSEEGKHLADLPSEILVKGLLPLLPPRDLRAFEATSKFFKHLVDENRHLCQKFV